MTHRLTPSPLEKMSGCSSLLLPLNCYARKKLINSLVTVTSPLHPLYHTAGDFGTSWNQSDTVHMDSCIEHHKHSLRVSLGNSSIPSIEYKILLLNAKCFIQTTGLFGSSQRIFLGTMYASTLMTY